MIHLNFTHRCNQRQTDKPPYFETAILAAGVLLFFVPCARGAIPQQEREALVSLFNNLGGAHWTSKTGWLGPAGGECSWYGVSCNPTQSSVTGLSLPGNGLVGKVPPEIDNLTGLQTLNLNNNPISSIPAEIGNLSNLQVLDLGYTDLSEPIPSTLGNLPKLQDLLISGYWLEGTIPVELGNLKQLRSLRLINFGTAYFQRGLLGKIPTELGNLTNLEILELSGNALSGGIPAELGNLTNLKVLDLSSNFWGGLGGSVPASLGNLRNLQTLKLRSNDLRGDFPSTLFDLANLQDLDLAANFLSDIPIEITRLTNLQILNYSSNSLTSIPGELGSLANLQDLELGGNYVGAIPAELGNLRNLRTLGLNYNHLSSIPSELGKLANLQSLDLSNNVLSNIPSELGNLTSLQTLDLNDNQFSGSIPVTLSRLVNLKTLDLSHNQLQGIPAGIADLRNLENLDLSFNQLSGNIPSSLGNLTNLQYFRLERNQFSGSIPPSLGNLKQLWSLHLEANNLSGNIPAELGNLTNLADLVMSENQLSSTIPSSLGNLIKLYGLGLRANQLSGSVPTSLANLTGCSIDIWYNALYAGDRSISTFLGSAAFGWDRTQTVAPSDVFAILRPDSSTLVSWQPIPFRDYEGRYEVWTSATSGGPYVLAGTTADKKTSSLLLTGLSAGTYLVVRTVTDSNYYNRNTVFSGYSAEITVGPPKVTMDLTLNDTGAATSTTFGGTEATKAGYAEVTLNPVSAPYGTAVFSFRQNGVIVSEAAVPASPSTTSARIFVDYRTGITIPGSVGSVDVYSGFAVVNRGDAPATVKFTLRSADAQIVATGSGTLAKGAHFARYVHQLPDILPGFSIPSTFPVSTGFGTLELTSNQPLSVTALRLTTNQRGDILMSSTPVADLTRSLKTDTVYFPQFVDGGGYTTSIVLMNTSSSVETGRLSILANDGSALPVRLPTGTSGSSFAYSIPPGGAYIIQSGASPAIANVGWVELAPTGGTSTPAGAGIFQYSQGGTLITESAVPAASPATHARIFVDCSGSHDTGLALGNPGYAALSISLTAFGLDGTHQFGKSQGPVSLNGKGHYAAFVDQLISFLPADFQGVLDIASDSPFAAMTLRSLVNERSDFLLTGLPAADMNVIAPFPIVFPQIADGGGYQTEFVLLGVGQSGSAAVRLFGDDGAPLAVGR